MLNRRQILQSGMVACASAMVGGLPTPAEAVGISQAIVNLRAKFPYPYSTILLGGQFAWLYMWRESIKFYNPLAQRVHGTVYVDSCISYLRRGDLVSLGAYIAQHNYNDGALEGELYSACKAKCFEMAGAVAQCVNALGGLNGARSSSPSLSQGAIYTKSEKQAEPWYTPWYGMVRYDPSALAGHVGVVRACLTAGYMVKAGVLSGIIAEKGLGAPDHYILIIGVDGDHFVAWDPDAVVSCRPEPAYCTLTHWKPADARHHRFGTSRSDNEFKCDSNGDFRLGGDITTSSGSYASCTINHRYQVTSLERV
jgi:hypothetical protein